MTPNASSPKTPDHLTARELYERYHQMLLLDVRTGWEYRWKHIPGAVRLQRQQILQQISKDQPIAVICLSGHRSVPVANWLSKQGYHKVYNLQGGFWRWLRSHYPTTSGA